MTHDEIQFLFKTRTYATGAIKSLEDALKPFEEKSPALFWKPLAEMGASDKLKISAALLAILDSNQ